MDSQQEVDKQRLRELEEENESLKRENAELKVMSHERHMAPDYFRIK